MKSTIPMTLSDWIAAGQQAPEVLSTYPHTVLDQMVATDPAWIYRLSAAELDQQLPRFGIL